MFLTSLPVCRFTVSEDPDFGAFLESVNGVAGNVHERTYWEILSENSGEYTRIDLGEFHPQSFNEAQSKKELMSLEIWLPRCPPKRCQ